MQSLSFIHKQLLDLILPRRCLNCGREKTHLCDQCLENLPTAIIMTRTNCSLYDYGHQLVKQAIWQMKYRGDRELARRFGQELDRRLLRQLDFPRPAFVVPIPMNKKRLRERGFNQSLLIAKGLIEANPATYQLAEHWLIKTKHTPTQVSVKHRRERLNNLRGSFAATFGNETKEVKEKTILLVDDILTTGGTLTEARKTLRTAGAKQVFGVTIAHG